MQTFTSTELSSTDAYEQFSDASTTPLWDLAIGLATLATVLGGGLAAIYAVGYLAVGRAALAWPLIATFVVLVAADLALRHGRRIARRR
jgi:energy-converting hydrogenase Eha subunit C